MTEEYHCRFPCDSGDVSKRADVFLSEKGGMTRSMAGKLLEDGKVSLSSSGKMLAKNYKLRAGDILCVELPEPEPCETKPQNLPLPFLFEDDDLAVVEKPKGMVVHPAPGNPDGTLVNALLYHLDGRLSGIGGVLRPGIVHRLDKDTSGILIVAKNDAAHLALSEQIKEHSFDRIYHAILVGNLKENSGTVDKPIGRHPTNRKKMAILESGRNAVTHYRVLERFRGFCYVELQLETGRTHQIRVHMASLGHPVVGDEVYGAGRTPFEQKHKDLFAGQCLHAKYIAFTHPITQQRLSFDTPLPPYFDKLLSLLRQTQAGE